MKFTKEQIEKAVAGINYWGSEILPEKRKAHYAEVMAENPELATQMQLVAGKVAEDFIGHSATGAIPIADLAELVNRIALAEFLFISQLLHKEI